MNQTAYNWDALGKRIKKTRLLFLFYIVSGIILLILSGSHLPLKTLIMSVIYPILFGSLLGYINHRYQTAIYKGVVLTSQIFNMPTFRIPYEAGMLIRNT